MFMQERTNILKIKQHLTQCWNKLFHLNIYKHFQLLSNLDLNLNDSRMASIPQGAFAACKIREQQNERETLISRMKKLSTDKTAGLNLQTQRDYSLVKYNDKLMNSIWGLYNRYSPHNVKKNEYAPREC